jgi:hypothetical protein
VIEECANIAKWYGGDANMLQNDNVEPAENTIRRDAAYEIERRIRAHEITGNGEMRRVQTVREAASRISTLERELEEARLAASVIEGISNELDIALTAAEAKAARMGEALKAMLQRFELYAGPNDIHAGHHDIELLKRARSALQSEKDREGQP